MNSMCIGCFAIHMNTLIYSDLKRVAMIDEEAT
jgi:hypothetical protein